MRARVTDVLLRFFFVFSGLYIITLSMDYALLPDGSDWLGGVMHRAAQFSGDLFFGVNLQDHTEFYSDSWPVHVHLFNVLVMSLLAAVVWTWRAKQNFSETQFYPLLFTMLRYFLALMLFMYGFSKIYKWQFYLPEPNTLYQTVGNTPRDLLYWTSMGTSYTYSIFMGVIEVIPAFLLLFRRTTVAGALIASLVLLNVVFINFGFDITVKIHSILLFVISVVILLPARKRLISFFTGSATETWTYPHITWQPKQKWMLPVLKCAVVLLLLVESNYRYFGAQNFNDDTAARPPMHGAYEVISASILSYDTTDASGPYDNIERIFLHRQGYIIFEMHTGEMIDFPAIVDTSWNSITYGYGNASTRRISWSAEGTDTLHFRGEFIDEELQMTVRKLDWRKLPLLDDEFTWIDEQ